MIFVVQQLSEKALKHHTKQSFVVDLCQAYDSVPQEAMWMVLRKLGVPEVLVDIVKSFHYHVQARVRVD